MFRTQGYGKPYNDKTRSMIFNLNDEKNMGPLLKLLKKQISPEELVTCDLRKLASEKLKKERNEAEKRGLWENRTDWDTELVKQ